MNSSISNSKSDFGIAASLIGLLVLVELVFRAVGPSLSSEMRQMATMQPKYDQLIGCSGLRIGFVGNSLLINGLDERQFERELSKRGDGEVHVELFALNGANVCEWYFMLRKLLTEGSPMALPDLVVIGYHSSFEDERDALRIHRLAQYTRMRNLPELFSKDLLSAGDRGEFIHCLVSVSFANRERVREAILGPIIPHYQAGILRLNEMRSHGSASGNVRPELSFNRLRRIIVLARERGLRIAFLSMPTVTKYSVDSRFKDLIQESRIEHLDMREVEGLGPESFDDAVHLSKGGKSIFTDELARRFPLNTIVRRQ